MAEDPSPLAEIPRQRDYAHDCLAEILQRIPSPAVRRPWQSWAAPAVRRPWQSRPSGAAPTVRPAWRLRQTQLLPGRPPRLTASPTTAAPWPYANHAWQPHCYAIRTSEWTSTCLRYQAEKRQCSCRRFLAFEPGLQLHGQLPRRKYPPGSLPCRR